ncbi:hypothetical protein [Nocardiopsis sp. LOL_012]|uniref:hypothetical protein n=1 Tax=Nocardiopsis sp. LOL_012 TaxID=3345409 RepID=UPI003A870845
MRRKTREYDTELRVRGEVLVVDGVSYQGRTVLEEGPDGFAPLDRWAKGVAETLGEPVTWYALDGEEVAARSTVQPERNRAPQNRRAL